MPRIALLSPSDTVTNIDPLISGLKRLRVALSALPSLPSLGRLAFQSLWVWLFLLPSCAISGFGSVTIDANVSADLSSAATQVTTPAFSTASGHELLLAFVAGDGSVPGMTSTVTGAGLNWVLVARANSAGTAEIWRAFSFLPLSNVTVTANLGQSGIASLQVVSFSGVDSSGIDGSGALGNFDAVGASSGAPTDSLLTTRNSSFVFGVGNDSTAAVSRTLGSNQTLVHQYLSPGGHTYWVQRQNSVTPSSGTSVTINDTAPTADGYNLSLCEILPPSGATAPSISSLSASSGAVGSSITITGSNFGATQGAGGVFFNGVASTIVSWGATSITALVPYGAVTGNVEVVAANGLSSNDLSFTVTASNGLAIDAKAFGDLTAAAGQVSTSSFSTTAGSELLLAFVATDSIHSNMQVTGVTGGGLTWALVQRTNTQDGDAEVWRAFAPTALSNVSVTATLVESVEASIQVLSFIGADPSGTNGSGAVGAVGSGNANPGAPTASLVTTRANSWVFGVGVDWDASRARTVGGGQVLTHQYFSSSGDTYWMQREINTTAASGTTVTISDPEPSNDKYNLSIVEILPATTAPLIASFTPSSAAAGTLVTVAGSNFGSAPAVTLNQQGGGSIAAPISSANATSIAFVIPAGAATGPITVTAGSLSAVSSTSLTITARTSYSLAVGPSSATVQQGSSAAYAVILGSANGFGQLAALSVSGLPSGVTATFVPPQITAGQTSILTVNAPASQPVGTAALTISATATIEGIPSTQTGPVSLAIQPATTSLVGRTVESDSNESPLGGITITLLGKDDAGHTTSCTGQTVSDAAGNFAFASLSAGCVGRQLVAYNGNTATDGEKYASVNLAYTITSGQIAGPELVHLPRIDNGETIMIQQNASTDQVVTFKTMPGVSATVYAHTILTLPDGTQPNPFPFTGVQVPVDRLPDTPIDGPGTLRAYIVAFQPADTTSNQPVAVTFPNILSTPPGVNMELDTLDPVVGMLVKYGTGTVSSDGLHIVPDPDPNSPGHNFGIVHFDWHGPMAPGNNKRNPCRKKPCAKGGDPVDLSSGLFVYNKTDIVFGGARGQVAIDRLYRTLSGAPGPFGIGTNHNYGYLLDASNFVRGTGTFLTLIAPDGNQFQFVQQTSGTFVSLSDPAFLGAVISNPSTGLYSLRLKDGTTYKFQTSALGPLTAFLVSIADTNNNVTSFIRANSQRPVQITQIVDPVGRTLNLSYDTFDRITSMIDPMGRVVSYAYNSQGRLQTVIDAAGGVTSYGYDSANRMATITDARGIVYLQNFYDSNGQMAKQINADGGTTTFAYTLLNPTLSVNTEGDGSTGSQVLSDTSENTSPVVLTMVTDPLGNKTTYHFNSLGYLVDETDALGEKTIYSLDPKTNQPTNITDPLGRTTAFIYDGNGNVNTVTRLAGTEGAVTTSFTYEPVFNKLASVTDPLGHTFSMSYDTAGNLLTVSDPLNHETTFVYDATGELVSISDALGNKTQLAYANGSLSSITDPLGSIRRQTADAVGRLLSVTTPLGQTTLYSYDPLNQIAQTIDSLGGVTTFAYDPNGNLLSFTDGAGHTTNWTYDSMDRISTRTDALQRKESFTYDLNGNLVNRTDRKGLVTSLTYDALNRRKLVGYNAVVNGGTSSYESTTTFTYDAGNRLMQAVDSAGGIITDAYDNLDRLTTEITARGVISYGYDNANRRTNMTEEGQPQINYSYDSADRLTQITQGTSSVGFSYDNANRRTSLTLPNGVITAYVFDNDSRLTGITYQLGTNTLGNLTYSYDQLGRRIQVGGSFARTGLPGAVTSAGYDAANELTTWNGNSISYDTNGNMQSDGSNTFTWNARNQLATLNSTILKYDAFGRRVQNAAGTAFLYDGPNAAQELSGSFVTATVWTGGVDELFQRADGNGTVSPLTDALGSVIGLTNTAGSVITAYSYDPFGNTVTNGATSANPSQYTGREREGNGLYYYRARYYSPLLGRFISEDPLGLAGSGVNVYAYAENNPIGFRDSFGLQAGDCEEGFDIYCVHSPEEIQQIRQHEPQVLQDIHNILKPLDDFYAAHPDLLSGRKPSPPPCAPMSGFSTGVAMSAETVNPFTSQGGGVWGSNRQGSGTGPSMYNYKGTGIGLDVGISLQSVWATGSGPWTGSFHSINVSAGAFSGSIFWSPGSGGWTGVSFGLGFGLPGVAYEETDYGCKGPA